MIIFKGFRYRVYLTPAQTMRAQHWEGALRFLWNIAHEQRLIGLARPKGERLYPSAIDQINELTELRAHAEWLADVPRSVSAETLVQLDLAWQRCFKKVGDKPHWKRRERDPMGFCEPAPHRWHLERGILRFPKLGDIRAVVHRPLEGEPRRCTLVRDGDQWFVSIVCAISLPDPLPRVAPAVAIDRGVVNAIADSDGRLVPAPRHFEHMKPALARAQRVVHRRRKGSKNWMRARRRVTAIHRKIRRQRDHFLHVESARYAKSHGLIVIENLNIKGLVRGKCGAAILDVGWARFAQMLRYKLAWTGGCLREVPAAYSSLTCAQCGNVDSRSRRSQAVFCCFACGHRDHADLNAAIILLDRANHSVQPEEGSPLEGARRARNVLRTTRRT